MSAFGRGSIVLPIGVPAGVDYHTHGCPKALGVPLPHEIVPPRNRCFAKAMRRDMTKAELRLWQRLRKPGLEGLRFRRQAPIGPYIVDFFCPERTLIVEVDGGQHGFVLGEARDLRRDAWLHERGFHVLRFWNLDVMTNLDGVCDAILAAAAEPRNELE